MDVVIITLLLAASAYFGWWRWSARKALGLPPGLGERLIPQIEALQQASERETAERIVQSLEGEFRHILQQRGVSSTNYRLVLPAPGKVDAVWVDDADGRRRTLAEFDEYLDQNHASVAGSKSPR